MASKRILVVDNDDKIRLALETHLQEAGYRAFTTWSGLEALDELALKGFDALLVDEYLPDLHIGQFLKQLSKVRGRPHVFIMQHKPVQRDIRFRGTPGVWPLVDKSQIEEIVRILSSLRPEFLTQ